MHQQLTTEAKKKNITLSEVIRQRLVKAEQPAQTQPVDRRDIFAELDKIASTLPWKDTPTYLSEQVDEILYG